jgi:hypothetical protein
MIFNFNYDLCTIFYQLIDISFGLYLPIVHTFHRFSIGLIDISCFQFHVQFQFVTCGKDQSVTLSF